jgi:ParB-like chromosome segregation protein Spo0J
MKHLKLFEEYNNYKETSWTDKIDGVDITIKISEIEDYLKDETVIKILINDIKHMCIHKDKKDEETKKRVESSDLNFPIIISKNINGIYNMILDGHHRLQKAINLKEKYIKAKVLDLKTAPKKYQIMFR